MARWILQVSAVVLMAFVAWCTGLPSNTTDNNTTANNTNTTEAQIETTTSPWTSKNSSTFSFDCRRGENTCDSGKCNLTSGKCDCGHGNSEDFNYACVNKTVDNSTCTPSCQNGFCKNGNCVCDESYYGQNCSFDRVQIICKDQSMFVNINPIDNFTGTIYAQGSKGCLFAFRKDKSAAQDYPGFKDELATFPGLEGWSSTWNHSCATNQTSNQTGQATELIWKLYIQYSELFKTSVDQIVTAKCTFSENKLSSQITNIGDSDSYLDNINKDGQADIVTLKVQNKDGLPFTRPVILGEEIQLKFDMNSTGGVIKNLRLSSCEANNTKAEDDVEFKKIKFISDGCPTQEGKSIFSGLPEKSTKSGIVTVLVKLRAFMFIDSNNVAFTCYVGFCQGNDSSCDQKDCPGFASRAAPATSDSVNVETTPASNNSDSANVTDDQPANSTNTTLLDTNSTSQLPEYSTTIQPPANNSGGGKRKKRSNDDSGASTAPQTINKSVGTVVNVIDPNAQNNSEVTGQSPTTKDCDNDTDVIAIIAILGVCVFLLFVVTVFLVFRLLESKKTTTETSFDTPPRPMENLRFPRLEMSSSQHGGC